MVGSDLFRRVPFIASAVTDQHRGNVFQHVRIQFRWNVATQGDEAAHRLLQTHGATKRHRHALRKPAQNQRSRGPFLRHGFNDVRCVGDVVGYRKLAILLSHPAGYDIVGATPVKTMKALNGNDDPLIGNGNLLQSSEVQIRGFGVP